MAADKAEINVVVTGGTPDLHLGYQFNTSELVRNVLPEIIARPGKPAINILKYPEGVPCIYSWVIDMTRKILSGDGALFQRDRDGDSEPFQPDLIVHLGMRGRPQPGYVFETLARKEGYDRPGQDGISFPQEMVNPGGEWADLPDDLSTDLDVEGIRAAVLAVLSDVDIQVSDKAGLYFCEFELWAALAELKLRGLPGKAAFIHVPQGNTEDDIRLGAKVVEEYLCAVFHGGES